MSDPKNSNKIEWLTGGLILALLILVRVVSPGNDELIKWVSGVGLITLVAQVSIKTLFDKRLEAYKAELNLNNTKQGKLHDKRLLVIADLYSKLVEVQLAFEDMTQLFHFVKSENPEQERIENINSAANTYNDFSNFFLKNRIYFSDKTCKSIEGIRMKFKSVYIDYTNAGKEDGEIYLAIRDTVKNQISPILEEIVDDFRIQLGVN